MSYNLCFSYPYMAALGIFGFIIFLLVGVVQIYAGFIGIDYLFGYWWAVAAVGASFLLRIMLPLTIGTFFWSSGSMGMAMVWCISFSRSRIVICNSCNDNSCSFFSI